MNVARKILTQDQAETAKKRAASFIRNVLQDDDRADEVEDEGLEEWAEETGRTITNPQRTRKPTMASGPTKGELQDTLDQVGGIVTDALDPALTREEVIAKLQEIDALINDDEDEDEDSDDDDDEDEEEEVVED